MKTLKKYINEISGLRYIFENLKLASSIGRKHLLNQKFLTNEIDLIKEFDKLSATIIFISNENNSEVIKNIRLSLEQINDIANSIKNLENKSILDDIELFEIKKLSLLSQKITTELDSKGYNILYFHNLTDVVNILDPEQTRIPSFYIYSAYSDELDKLRKKQKEYETTNSELAEQTRLKCVEIEDKIRENLSDNLSHYAAKLKHNLNSLAYLDILIAKAMQAKEQNLCKPEISNNKNEYSLLFNPYISNILESQAKEFQAIDINLKKEPVLITGANMSGKTVLLKTIALAQYMFQFGFYVPAKSAKIQIFDDIMFSIGDKQSELNGLSSFAVEMLNINEIVSKVKSKKKVLALVDELARTTNPKEGMAIVKAFIEMMSENNVASVITTHYSIENTKTRKLRVVGLDNIKETDNINIDNINNFIDYSLIEIENEDVPKEAIKIAEILKIDSELINKMKEFL